MMMTEGSEAMDAQLTGDSMLTNLQAQPRGRKTDLAKKWSAGADHQLWTEFVKVLLLFIAINNNTDR